MFDNQYVWATSLGFWFGIGIIEAIAISFAMFYFIGKLVNKAFGFFCDDSVSKYEFSVLPAHYKSMALRYDSKTKTVTATAKYIHNGVENTRSYSRVINDESGLEVFAQNVQLTLMTTIAKEIEEWNKLQS